MKVSVTIITYNQSRFIRKAIDSALAQQTTFPFEILVGDDCSTDDTPEIIKQYEQQYPGKVIGVLQTHNLGQNGLLNCLETLKRTRGEYYAIIDGDDYWTDPLKLQKQVDYLEAHPTYSAVFSNALITYEDGSPSQGSLCFLPRRRSRLPPMFEHGQRPTQCAVRLWSNQVRARFPHSPQYRRPPRRRSSPSSASCARCSGLAPTAICWWSPATDCSGLAGSRQPVSKRPQSAPT